MARNLLRWVIRLALLAVVATVLAKVLEASDWGGAGDAPVIGGDTWPPVPPNPGRTD
jgi:hypothetical protein